MRHQQFIAGSGGTALLDTLFLTLQKAPPYTWQRQMFAALCQGEVPDVLQVPTGGGKTAVILVFVAALATQAQQGHVTLPRRLVLAVNRRSLVDQASSLVLRLHQALDAPELAAIAAALRTLSATGQALQLTTLRGQLADNRLWSHDPSTPAILLATPDMLGSRLLFQGYGLGRSRQAMEAGLLGIDTLLVLDESHLSPTFTALAREIAVFAHADAKRLGRPALHVLEMSATLHAKGTVLNGSPDLLAPDPADFPLIQRMQARKALQIRDLPIASTARPAEADKALEAAMLSDALAFKDEQVPVVLFVDKPDMAVRLLAGLKQAGIPDACRLAMTGTLRGHERDKLIDSPTFQPFIDGSPCQQGSHYFVCTSAGEIGLDIDARHALGDQTTLARQIQRFGRVNRRGEQADSRIILYRHHAVSGPEAERLDATWRLLESLPDGNASPLALSRLMQQAETEADCRAALPEVPRRRRLEPGLLDLWAMTSLPDMTIPLYQYPTADCLIHALDENNTADVTLVWRTLPEKLDYEYWLTLLPPCHAEMARLPCHAAIPFFRELARTAGGKTPVLLQSGRRIMATCLEALEKSDRLAGSVVILPCDAGGLSDEGLPGGRSTSPVSDLSGCLCLSPDESGAWHYDGQVHDAAASLVDAIRERLGVRLLVDPPFHILQPDETGHVPTPQRLCVWPLPRQEKTPEDHEQSSLSKTCLLTTHLTLARRAAVRLAGVLDVPPPLATAVIGAAAGHDAGKAESRWQAAFGNPPGQPAIAKSHYGQRPDLKRLAGYRHELGSVAVLEKQGVTDALTLHLVGAHHGHARPGFSPVAAKKMLTTLAAGERCGGAAHRAAWRYAQLQQDYGWWGLAYLEALVKCADILAETHADTLMAEGNSHADPA